MYNNIPDRINLYPMYFVSHSNSILLHTDLHVSFMIIKLLFQICRKTNRFCHTTVSFEVVQMDKECTYYIYGTDINTIFGISANKGL